MTIELDRETERLIAEQLASGRYGDAADVIHRALRALNERETQEGVHKPLSPKERLRAVDAFFRQVDDEPAPEAPPLSADALRRENLYDDRRHQT